MSVSVNKFETLFFSFIALFVMVGCRQQSSVKYGVIKLDELDQLVGWSMQLGNYRVSNEDAINSFNLVVKDSKAIVVFGSWDTESKKYVPEILNILIFMGFPQEATTLVNVDQSLFEPSGIVANLHAKSIPALFFVKDGEIIVRVENVYDPVEEAISENGVVNSCTADNP